GSRTATSASRAPRLAEELAHHRRLARVEAFGVESLVETVELVIEVVAELVDERAQERPELDDLLALRGAHPQRDPRGSARDLVRFIEPLQLATGIGRPAREHAHDDGRRLHLRVGRVHESLAWALHLPR